MLASGLRLVRYCILLTLLSLPVSMRAAFSQAADAPPDADVVEITATDYAFRAPSEIASGWNTIRFSNEGEEPHFVLMSRLPEGKTLDDYETEISQPFNEVWMALLEGKVDRQGAFEMLGGVIPEWYPTLTFMGGPGYVAPGREVQATFRLEPGDYVLECYMKTEDGAVHFMEGMLRPMTVTDAASSGAPPKADVRITLSNFEMQVDGALGAGERTFAVHVEENPEAGFGHNVHLARLDDETTSDDIVQWMDWFNTEGARTPAPAEFLGGVHLMPVGSTAYFTADLKPGRYLLVSEYTGHRGVLHEFTVAP